LSTNSGSRSLRASQGADDDSSTGCRRSGWNRSEARSHRLAICSSTITLFVKAGGWLRDQAMVRVPGRLAELVHASGRDQAGDSPLFGTGSPAVSTAFPWFARSPHRRLRTGRAGVAGMWWVAPRRAGCGRCGRSGCRLGAGPRPWRTRRAGCSRETGARSRAR
jgi:hypothetical protein